MIHESLREKPRFSGMISAIKFIYSTQGIKNGFYKGVESVILRQAANSGVRMSSYSFLKEYSLKKYGKEMPWYINFVNGTSTLSSLFNSNNQALSLG